MSKNTHSAAPTKQELSDFLGKSSQSDDQSEETEFRGYKLGKQHNFLAINGRSSIKIGVMMSKEGWKLSLFDDPDDNQPERKALIVRTPLEAAQRFVDSRYVGLELQPC